MHVLLYPIPLFKFQELFGAQGVNMVVQYLQTDPQLLTSGLGHHKLLLAAVDTVWSVLPHLHTFIL